jgi:hypothetical protein
VRRPGEIAVSLIIAAAILVGCSSDDERMKVCPRVAVLSEAGKITRFRPGPGRDILDINFEGDIGDIVASCEFADTKKGARRVTVQVAPVFVFSRGAANTDPQIDFTYFVSVVKDGDILSKQQFEAQTAFIANRSRVIVQDDDPPITIDIPLPYKGAEYEYEVLVGFQLTADELAYNRRWQGLGR